MGNSKTQDRTALVTGSARRIGKAIAKGLAADGEGGRKIGGDRRLAATALGVGDKDRLHGPRSLPGRTRPKKGERG